MKITRINPDITLPKRGSADAAGFDVFTPSEGHLFPNDGMDIKLGFATAIPKGYAAIMVPRSSWGSKGLVLRNTVGLIDSDYRGEWQARIVNTGNKKLEWNADERLFQFFIVPIFTPELEVVGDLDETIRGEGGFGSTGA